MGVRITVVTWSPDVYGYGKVDYWMQLHEEMRMAGIYVEQKEDFCEHYAVIDNEIVWYGSMNLLGKENAEDNLMLSLIHIYRRYNVYDIFRLMHP